MTITTKELIEKLENYSENSNEEHPWQVYKEEFLKSPKQMCEIIYRYPDAILDITDNLRDSEDFILALISLRDDLENHFNHDIEQHYFIYKNIGLGSASDRIKNDKLFIEKVLSKNGGAFHLIDGIFHLIGEDLKRDVEFIKKCLVEYRVNPSYIPEDTILDGDFAEEHLKDIPYIAKYIEKDKLNDKNYLLDNIKDCAYLLLNTNDILKNDYELVLELAKQNKDIFSYIGNDLRNNPLFLKQLIEITNEDYFSKDPFSYRISQAFSEDLKTLIENTETYHPWIKKRFN